MRGVTFAGATITYDNSFQPALPMRGVTLTMPNSNAFTLISTRTPHAGSDDQPFSLASGLVTISTRTPHAGSDLAIFSLYSLSRDNFNPHSPCGE